MAYQSFTVRFILNGLLVKVGCQYIHFKSVNEFSDALKDYVVDEYL